MYSTKECTSNKKKDPLSPWITSGLLKSIIRKSAVQMVSSLTKSNKSTEIQNL